MDRGGLLVREVTRRTGATRKALRLYEAAGILVLPRRTAAGYRVYGPDTLSLLAFVRQAQRLGFSLDEIKEVVSIKRVGRAPCPHVRDLVRGRRRSRINASRTSKRSGTASVPCSGLAVHPVWWCDCLSPHRARRFQGINLESRTPTTEEEHRWRA